MRIHTLLIIGPLVSALSIFLLSCTPTSNQSTESLKGITSFTSEKFVCLKIDATLISRIDKLLSAKGIIRGATLTRLKNGDICIVGGFSGEAESNRTWRWSSQKNILEDGPLLNTQRAFCTALTLKNGNVLVSGGNSNGEVLASAEIVSFNGKTSKYICDLSIGRTFHECIQLDDEHVMISGGTVQSRGDLRDLTGTLELLNLRMGTSSLVGRLKIPRMKHSCFIENKNVFFSGGFTYLLDSSLVPTEQTEVCSAAQVRALLIR